MRKKIMWIVLSFKAAVIAVFAFLRTPEEIAETLLKVTTENKWLAVVMHAVYVVLAGTGFAVKRIRNTIFSVLLLILAGTALAVSIRYVIPPNIMTFAVFFILTVKAIVLKELNFEVSEQAFIGKIIGFTAIAFGFYYLHWVEEPLFLNALVYSPLGLVNCPTMAAFSGFLCFLRRPGSPMLEAFVGFITLYFGFFGIMRLGAYVDIVLIAAGAFLLIRLASSLGESFFQHRRMILKGNRAGVATRM